MLAALSPLEQRVVDEIDRRADDLTALTSELVAYDTTTHEQGRPPRDEAALQEALAARLRHAGADVDLWVPDATELRWCPYVPEWLRFEGRPQLAARFAGAGGGRSLLLNGHVDVVSAEPVEAWSSDPFVPEVRDGRLYGRGACDMKGGVACMVLAAETLASLGVRLRGDLIVNTVTEEESTGAGGAAAVARGVRADAAIVPEASGFDVWIACRGSLLPTITVEGRGGHAGLEQPHHSRGGAVNAIEKMRLVLDALERLRLEWRSRERHDLLPPPDIVPTIIGGGEWIVSVPSSCRLECHIEYLPSQAGDDGLGGPARRELEEWLARAARADPWLADHPPRVEWNVGAVPPAEVPADHPIVDALAGAAAAVGVPGRVAGLDNWHDGATFTRFADTPAVCFGPGGWNRAHAVDEYVPVADLVACAQAIAVAAVRFCGV